MRSSSIRTRLLLLVLAATLPVLLFSAAALDRAFKGGAALVEQVAMGHVRQITLALDGTIARANAVIQALADADILDQSDPATFEAVATRALADAGIEGKLTLAAPNQAGSDRDGTQRVFESGEPQISGLLAGDTPSVALHMPVQRHGALAFDAVLTVPVGAVAHIVERQALPENWVAVVADADGRILARTLASQASLGQPVSDDLSAAASVQPDGYGQMRTREGAPVYAAFAHSARSGWLVGIAIPAPIVRGPLLRSAIALTGVGGLVLLAGLALAWLIGRTVARPMHSLSREAERLGRGELLDTDMVRGVAEAEAASRALRQAGHLLIARGEEREAALRRAEASETRLLLAQETAAIGSWETDFGAGTHVWSHKQSDLYGLDPHAPPPTLEQWSRLIHEEDRDRVVGLAKQALTQPRQYQHEFRIVQPGGGIRWLRSAVVSQFQDGRALRMFGITLDTTDRHEAERTLREGAARLEAEVAARTRELAESESRFRTYFDHSADALLVVRVEPGGRFVYETVNKAAERLTGYRASDLVGKTPDEVLLKETAASVLESYRQAVTLGAELKLEQAMAFSSQQLELETVLVPVFGSDHLLTRIIVGHRDLTEQRRLEGRLSHAQRLEAVGQLTGGVAHDFNNLLTVVVGNLSLLRNRLGDDARALRYLGSIEAAAQRGAKLTASLLAFSRRQTLHVAPLDVGAQLQESATLLQRALGEDIAFSLEVAPGLPPGRADAAQLEAAVLNLAINARDAINAIPAMYGRREGSLQIRVNLVVLLPADLEGNDEARPGRFIAVEVRDNGVGMTPEVRARAFEPFFTTKEIGRGTGLGLSQVFGFVRQLGGHVVLDSRPGLGTRAVLYIPEAPPQECTAVETSAGPTAMPPEATVLVVEDDDGIRDVTAEVLGEAGLTVRTASNGALALDVLRGPDRVDLLFSDVVMPGGATGLDLARAARTLRPNLAVLLTSGYGGPALSRYGAEGEYEILAKPYTRADLLQRICTILAGQPPTPAAPLS